MNSEQLSEKITKVVDSYKKLVDHLEKCNNILKDILDKTEKRAELLEQTNNELQLVNNSLNASMNKLISKYGEEAEQIVMDQFKADGFQVSNGKDEENEPGADQGVSTEMR